MTLDILIPKITAVIFGISAVVGLIMHAYYEIVETDPFFEQDCAMKLIYWGKPQPTTRSPVSLNVQFFPKAGKVHVGFTEIGKFRRPGARTPKWVFVAYDGRVTRGALRKDLVAPAISAYRRKHIEC